MRDEFVSIHAGWVIDGSGGAIQSNMRLGITNGTIRSVRKMTQPVPDSTRADMPLLDLSDCTLLPGLIDCHVHLALSPTARRKPSAEVVADEHNRFRRKILKHLNQLLARGVLAVRDGGDPSGSVLLYKANSVGGDHPVHLCVAGRARHRPGRYGHLIGCALSPDRTLAETILEEKKGVDHVKIVNSGLNSLSCFAKETKPQFDLAELKAAVRAARQCGLKTMVHANGKLPVKIAVDAGCDSIEHGFFMGEENLNRMADRGTTWVPTAFTMKALADQMKRNGIDTDVVRKNLEHQIQQIQTARETGVCIALGTDAGSAAVVHGQAVIEEIRIFLDAGFSIEEAVRCATHNGALLMGLPRVGQLKEDMPATLIAVKGAPSQLPESLNQIEMIFYKGKQINIDSYDLK
ncbi:MAG: amidohydrolase family protein [Desulfobacterales bacterium]